MSWKACGTLLVLALVSPVARASAACDAINLSQVIVYNSPADIASWPVTSKITQLTMQPTAGANPGLSFQASARNTWPDYTPPGWDGPIQYTVWAVVKINGQWYASGIIQMWRERPSTGAPLLTDFARNWVYDSRWGPMQGHQPVVGEQMGFFLSAGNARGVGTVTSVRERTNVVMVPVPAGDTGVFTFSNQKTTMDFDGDCRTDIGIFRPSTGEWWGLASTSNYVNAGRVVWGISTDIPVPADYDGDGKTDVGVFRPSNGTWYILLSSTGFQGSVGIKWGMSGDIPVPGDYDGDGKADLAVHRPSTGTWGILRSSSNYTTYAAVVWGMSTDIPVPGDYDGDGLTDIAVYRPSSGTWGISLSSTSHTTYRSMVWGVSTDIPVPGDYDGDGKADVAVYRPSTGTWGIAFSGGGYGAYQKGTSTDIPVPADYDGDGKVDLAVYTPVGGQWSIWLSSTGYATRNTYVLGTTTDWPMAKHP